MSESMSIKCDNCDEERVTHSSYPATYTLELSCINTNINNTGMQYAVAIKPKLDGKKHFCGFKCLREWIEKRLAPIE